MSQPPYPPDGQQPWGGDQYGQQPPYGQPSGGHQAGYAPPYNPSGTGPALSSQSGLYDPAGSAVVPPPKSKAGLIVAMEAKRLKKPSSAPKTTEGRRMTASG